MRIQNIGLMAMGLSLLALSANAEPGHGLGSEQKCPYVATNQQSGWWATSGDAASEKCASKCSSKCFCGSQETNRGLATEKKDKHIATNQQSGWWFESESCEKPAAKGSEQPEAQPVAAVEKPAPVLANARVDTDGDGVIDEKDNCEGTPHGTKVDASGCPEAAKAIPDKDWTLKGVQFETGSDRLKRSTLAALDEAADVLKTHTRVVVEIQGHTDNVGGNRANQALSEKRAQAVKAYLIEKGVPARRLEARGYGESVPVADNKTVDGRAQNRRIAFKVITR